MIKNLVPVFAFVVGLSATFAIAQPAHAEKLLIARYTSDYFYGGTQFRFDAAQGKAWMEVHLAEQMWVPSPFPGRPDGTVMRDEIRSVPVAGLSFDAAAAQILFTGQSGKFVCATVTEKHGVFGGKWLINLTGACRAYSVFENRGYSVYFEAK